MNIHEIKTALLEKYPNGNITALEKYIAIVCSNDTDVYTEMHHILPKHDNAWPEYKEFKNAHPWNMVKLSGKNHFIAHYWLAKFSDDINDWKGVASNV